MTERLDLNDPNAVLLRVADALRRAGVENAAYGGLALAVYGEARETKDADLAIADADTQVTEAALQSMGVTRAVEGTLRGEVIRVLAPEDFVLFKVLSTRERDLEDAATVLRAFGPRLDHAYVTHEGARLAAEIPDHDVGPRLARARALVAQP